MLRRFALPLVALLCCAAELATPSAIEREFETLDRSGDLILTLVGKHIVARSSIGPAAPKRIMRIESSRAERGGRTFRFFYLRAGVLEAFYEYHWSAPEGSLAFRRSRERRVELAEGEPTRGGASLRAGELRRLLGEARELHQAVLEQRARIEARDED